ncbi:MAG TPA: hypothetical protein VGH42_10575 [Verrucomicrobiae bacterium]|jgi:hypothetical protein
MLPAHLVKKFPKLLADGAKKTSEATNQYNCIAWSAARDTQQWYEPEKFEPWYHWPSELPPKDYTFENFVRLFENLGYKKRTDARFEILYKKVAIYAIYGYFEKDKWGFSHVCDQLNSGGWTSKLGDAEDIKHNSLESLEGNNDEYGEVKIILKRRCNLFDIFIRAFFKIRSWL